MKTLTVLCALTVLSINSSWSQGCSDAGVCSIGGLKDNGSEEKHYAALNIQYAIGEQNVRIFTPQLEGLFRIREKYGIQVKVPYTFTGGNLGAVNGFGDITLAGMYKFYDKKKWKAGMNMGVKIGTNKADKKTKVVDSNLITLPYVDPYSAPMPYQTSLGTTDLLFGLDARYGDWWSFGLGLQVPVLQFNRNTFDTALAKPAETEKKSYFSSAHLYRQPDLILRVDRKIEFIKKKLFMTLGVLPIYHLSEDRITVSRGSTTVRQSVDGSDGLTLNLTGSLSYRPVDDFLFIFRYAAPAIVRKVRPDGLTRHWVSGLEIRYMF